MFVIRKGCLHENEELKRQLQSMLVLPKTLYTCASVLCIHHRL